MVLVCSSTQGYWPPAHEDKRGRVNKWGPHQSGSTMEMTALSLGSVSERQPNLIQGESRAIYIVLGTAAALSRVSLVTA